MTPLVVDASVVAAAFLPEPYHDLAAGILASDRALHAPDLLLAELGNVAWKRHARGELSAQEAEDLLADVLRLPIAYAPSSGLVSAALPLAMTTAQTVYDSLYVALAIELGARLVTADQRLVRGLEGTPLAAQVEWLGAQGS